MQHTLAIRREDLSKRGEKRVAIVPVLAKELIAEGHRFLVQPSVHPETAEVKRIFPDHEYQEAGAEIAEDLSEADIIFGIKEIGIAHILPEKTYCFFSHTHKGQKKNREMLRTLVERKATVIDYELIRDETGMRTITAFTFFAGYAGMIDSLWALGQRLKTLGIQHPFSHIPQASEKGDLQALKTLVGDIGEIIRKEGTPQEMPPLVTCFLGRGKTSHGAQLIYDLLPSQQITLEELPGIIAHGSRKQVYKLVMDVCTMYRVKMDSPLYKPGLSSKDLYDLYFAYPQHFESNLDQVFPYVTMMMNCIIWSPEYPRLLTRESTADLYGQDHTLQVIGDITCDPEGAIEFSKETWIDNPVFTYDPVTRSEEDGFAGQGIVVMAVTNLPCEFSADSSTQFSLNLTPLLSQLVSADYEAATLEDSGLPEILQEATFLWRGEFTPSYVYMQEFL